MNGAQAAPDWIAVIAAGLSEPMPSTGIGEMTYELTFVTINPIA